MSNAIEISDGNRAALQEETAIAAVVLEMLDAIEERVRYYGKILCGVIEIVNDQRDPECWRHREHEIDAHVAVMMREISLKGLEGIRKGLEGIRQFLIERNIGSGVTDIRIGEWAAPTACELAWHVLGIAQRRWERSKVIAHRSQTQPEFLYSVSASHIFYDKGDFASLPRPQALITKLDIERTLVRKHLRDSAQAITADARDHPEKKGAVKPAGGSANMTVAQAQGKLLERSKNEDFTSYTNEANLLGCASSTVHKAVKRDAQLLKWVATSKVSPRATNLNDRVADRAVQGTEQDPAMILEEKDIDAALIHLMDKALPEQKAMLQDHSPEEREKIAQLYYQQNRDDKEGSSSARPFRKQV